MDPATTLRKLGKLEYAAARLPLSLLDACVVRHWHEDTAARVGFERYLGTLDLLAGRLLTDDAIRERGRLLWHSAGRRLGAGDSRRGGSRRTGGGAGRRRSGGGAGRRRSGGGASRGDPAAEPAAGRSGGASRKRSRGGASRKRSRGGASRR